MGTTLINIGTFSRASGLSIKALRAYHEGGILVPAVVDPDTGYRSYDPGQLSDALVLRRLRDLDVPLAEVRRVLHARDQRVTKEALARHATEIQARLDELGRIVLELQEGVLHPELHTPVHARVEEPAQILAVDGDVADAGRPAFFADAFDRSYAMAAEAGADVAGAPSALYPAFIDDDLVGPVVAYVAISAPVALPDVRRGVRLAELPRARVAVHVHHGDFDTMDLTYSALGTWVATHGGASGEPAREH